MQEASPHLSAEDLQDLGQELIVHLFHREKLDRFPLLSGPEWLRAFTMMLDGEVTPEIALCLVTSVLASRVESGDFAESSLRKVSSHLGRFTTWLSRSRSVTDVRNVTATDAISFINLPAADRHALKASTRANRKYALKLYFSILRELSICAIDPISHVQISRNDSTPTRPLTDTEINMGRLHSSRDVNDLRGPCAWAFAEATATTSEIPRIIPKDIDLDSARVWLDGGSRNVARWGHLTDWGIQRVQRFLDSRRFEQGASILYSGTAGSESAQAVSCGLVGDSLFRAGLKSDDAVRPASIPAWAGARVFASTKDIVQVANRLGIRSLDDAARTIGLDWDTLLDPPAHRTCN